MLRDTIYDFDLKRFPYLMWAIYFLLVFLADIKWKEAPVYSCYLVSRPFKEGDPFQIEISPQPPPVLPHQAEKDLQMHTSCATYTYNTVIRMVYCLLSEGVYVCVAPPYCYLMFNFRPGVLKTVDRVNRFNAIPTPPSLTVSKLEESLWWWILKLDYSLQDELTLKVSWGLF